MLRVVRGMRTNIGTRQRPPTQRHARARRLVACCSLLSCESGRAGGVQRVVAVLLPLAGLVDLSLGAAAGWGWGIFLGLLGLALGMCVGYKVYQAVYQRAPAEANDKSLIAVAMTAVQRFACMVFPYVLLTALVQAVPQGRRPQWAGLQRDGFPTACRAEARNCVHLGNGTDIYAAGKETDMVPPVLGGSRAQVLDQVQAWVWNQGGRVVFRSPTVVRATFVTTFMGYQDDLAAAASCLPDAHTLVNLQSQSRLGVGDMGVNARRLESLISFLQAECPHADLQAADPILQATARRREVSGSPGWGDRGLTAGVRSTESSDAQALVSAGRCNAQCS